MELTIFRKSDVSFPSFGHVPSDDAIHIERNSSRWLKADIQPTNDLGRGTDNFYWRLKQLLNKTPWRSNDQTKSIDWRFGIKVAVPNTVVQQDSEVHHQFSRLTIYSKQKEDFLYSLMTLNEQLRSEDQNDNICLALYATQFGLFERAEMDPGFINFKSYGLKFEEAPVETKVQIQFDQINIPDEVMLKWKQDLEFASFMKITVQLTSKAVAFLYEMTENVGNKYWPMQNILMKEICSDLVIVVGQDADQISIKCHRCFLAAHSKTLHNMLTSGMTETIEKTIVFRENTENGIRSVLAFLYYKNIEAMVESSEIAFEVLQFAEQYDIEELWEVTQDIMLIRENSWFHPDVALELHRYIKCRLGEQTILADKPDDIEPSSDDDGDIDMEPPTQESISDDNIRNQIRETMYKILKKKCLSVLKWFIKTKPKTLYDCDTYKRLLQDHPQSLLEISGAVI